MKTDSTLLTILPFSSDAFDTFCHSGSSRNAFQLAVAAECALDAFYHPFAYAA